MGAPAELDRLVEDLYARAHAGPWDVWRPSKLARALLGPTSLVLVPHLRELAQVSMVLGQSVIAVRSRLPAPIREWAIGHELGHWAGLTDETECDYVGAAIQMRRRPFLNAQNSDRDAWLTHASRFCVTTTSAVLRAGETEGRPFVVVTPGRVYARGEAEWPAESTLRMWARRGGGPGVRAAKLPDDPKRVVLEGLIEDEASTA